MDAKWLSEQLQQSGRSQTDLAKRLGVHPSVVNKMVKGKRPVKLAEVPVIHSFFGSQPDMQKRDPEHDTLMVRQPAAPFNVAEMNSWPRDVPVYGTALGGATGGEFVMDGDTGMRVRRPPRLVGRPDIIALFVQGEGMSPRFEQGELVYLEQSRPPQIGDYVVVNIVPGSNAPEPYLKQLVGRTASIIKLRQLNPPQTIEIDAAAVLKMHRVMTLQDIVG